MPRSTPERRAPAPQEQDGTLRKNIDTKTKRLGIRQTRGEGADPNMERVSIQSEDGKERFVSMSREELKKAEARADRDFERAINAVTAGEELDKEAVSKLMGSNKEQILALARKEGDVQGAVYKVMEDAVSAYQEYDTLVDKAVKESGYTGIVADGLRDALQSERARVFADAFSASAGPRAKRNLENAVRAKILAETSKRISDLNETVGTPAEVVQQAAEAIRSDIARLEGMKTGAESNALDRQIQEQTTDWARAYLHLNPNASPKDVLREAKSAGLDEYVTAKDVSRIKDGMSKEELYQKTIVEIVRPGAVKKGAEMARETAITDETVAAADAEARAKKTTARLDRQAKDRTNYADIVDRDAKDVVRAYAEAPVLEQAIVDDGSYDTRLGLSKADRARAEQAVARRGKTKEADRPMRMDEYDVPKYMGSERGSAVDEDLDVIDVTGDIRKEIARLDSVTDPGEMHALDRKIQQQTAEWAKDYLFLNPKASAKEVMAQAATEGFDEYITEQDVDAIMNGKPLEQLYQSGGTRLMEADALDRGLDAKRRKPAEYGSDEWIMEGARAFDNEIPDVTADLEDDEPGIMQRIASSGFGKWVKRGMLALGLAGGAAGVANRMEQHDAPSREPMAMMAEAPSQNTIQVTREGNVVADTEHMEVEQNDSLLKQTPRPAERVHKGDPRLRQAIDTLKAKRGNLEGALKTLEAAGFPTKAEYQKMKTDERKAEIQSAIERMAVMRELSSPESPVLNAMKKAELKQKLEQHQQFLDLMKSIRE